MSKLTNEDLSPLELMFIDTFPEEAKEFVEENGCKLTTLSEPIEAEIGCRYEVNGQYEIRVQDDD